MKIRYKYMENVVKSLFCDILFFQCGINDKRKNADIL